MEATLRLSIQPFFLETNTFTKSKKEVWHRAGVCAVSVRANGTAHRGHGALAATPSEALAPVIPEFQ